MTGPTLRLSGGELLSKWGFNDGDMPEGFLDWCDQHGHDDALYVDWHAVLRLLVAERLLPALQAQVELADIGHTSHNPVRASTWNGQDVESAWTGDPPILPNPVTVEVPYAEVLDYCRRVMATP